MTFTGTLSDINGALEGLSFTPDANYFGDADLTITSNEIRATTAPMARRRTRTAWRSPSPR